MIRLSLYYEALYYKVALDRMSNVTYGNEEELVNEAKRLCNKIKMLEQSDHVTISTPTLITVESKKRLRVDVHSEDCLEFPFTIRLEADVYEVNKNEKSWIEISEFEAGKPIE